MSDFLAHLRHPEVPDWLRIVYALVFLTTFTHAILSWGAWICCPPAYGEPATFAHAVQTAGGWTLAAIAIGEVMTTMVLIVPKVYYGIKNEGIAEGRAAGREEGRKEGREEGKAEGKAEGIVVGKSEGIAEGISQGVEKGLDAGIAAGIATGERAERERIAAALEAAGITDPETRRIVMNGQRNGK